MTDVTLDLLDDVASAFATRDAARVRNLRDSEAHLDREMWGRIAEVGWLSMVVPEELDGAGLDMAATVIVTRALGRGAFPEPFVAAGVLAPMVLAAAEDDACHERLAAVMAGELVVGVGSQGEVAATARGTLTGESRCTGIAGADAYVAGAGSGLYLVEAGAPGVSVIPQRLADGSFTARLELTDAPALLLVPDERGGEVLAQALDAARVALSGELVGIADTALELTLDHLRQRRQFGRPLGAFQALQHRAVDMWVQRELASAALQAAVRVHVDERSSARERAIAASSTKARAASAATSVCNAAFQLHGAIGFTDEYDLGLYLNRALALAPWLGNAAESRRRWLDLVEGSQS
ncbi:MAG TPA: acyl-CoA dehydrogenase family protein [Solirubrobacteraceae bacterium]|nr:acyl-CoA dehydrogenase family protein [Solirubrobacteraceae bacterium]